MRMGPYILGYRSMYIYPIACLSPQILIVSWSIHIKSSVNSSINGIYLSSLMGGLSSDLQTMRLFGWLVLLLKDAAMSERSNWVPPLHVGLNFSRAYRVPPSSSLSKLVMQASLEVLLARKPTLDKLTVLHAVDFLANVPSWYVFPSSQYLHSTL